MIDPVRSRCLCVRIPAPTVPEVQHMLAHVCRKENLSLPPGLSQRVSQVPLLDCCTALLALCLRDLCLVYPILCHRDFYVFVSSRFLCLCMSHLLSLLCDFRVSHVLSRARVFCLACPVLHLCIILPCISCRTSCLYLRLEVRYALRTLHRSLYCLLRRLYEHM